MASTNYKSCLSTKQNQYCNIENFSIATATSLNNDKIDKLFQINVFWHLILQIHSSQSPHNRF